MSIYNAYVKASFKRCFLYKMNSLLGIINLLIQILISCEIWKVLYAEREIVNNIFLSVVMTNFIVSLGISNILVIDDYFVQNHISKGTIICELLRPIDLKKRIIAENTGCLLYKLIVNYIPTIAISISHVEFCKPANGLYFSLFVISVMFGIAILWSISLIVQMLSFWIINVWSVSTIKNVLINILSGCVVPIWFMPDALRKIIELTPFESIYYIPLQLYLGFINVDEIWVYYLKQLFWLVLLVLLGDGLWKLGKRRIVMQGG